MENVEFGLLLIIMHSPGQTYSRMISAADNMMNGWMRALFGCGRNRSVDAKKQRSFCGRSAAVTLSLYASVRDTAELAHAHKETRRRYGRIVGCTS